MKNIKAVIFISVVSLCCVFLLTFLYQFSKPIISENEKMDIIKSVLYTFDIEVNESMTPDKIKATFSQNVTEKKVQGLPYYIHEKSGSKKYSFPVVSKGLWGMIYGYISLHSDLKTIGKITFSKHAETPGLGALIDEPFFKNQFNKISMLANDGSFGLVLLKAGSEKKSNGVDSITGATITSDGVVKGVNDTIKQYRDLLK